MPRTRSVSQGNLNVTNSAELLSYVINQTPVLKENLDLPVPEPPSRAMTKCSLDLSIVSANLAKGESRVNRACAN